MLDITILFRGGVKIGDDKGTLESTAGSVIKEMDSINRNGQHPLYSAQFHR